MATGKNIRWQYDHPVRILAVTLKYALAVAGMAYTLRFCTGYLVINPEKAYPVFTLVTVICMAAGVLVAMRSKWLDRKAGKSSISPRAVLSTRETEVFHALLSDQNNREICDALFIEMSTLKTHINRIYKKLEVKDRKTLRQFYAGL